MQKVAETMIRHTSSENRFSHAYLFEGLAQSKDKIAQKLIQSVFCKDSSPCGLCDQCQAIQYKTHHDVHEIQPDGKWIKVDQVRVLREKAGYKSIHGQYVVFLIREADRMNPQAQNALLKHLEEPDGKTIFILMARKSHAMLDTIVSRCQLVPFHPEPFSLGSDKDDLLNHLTSDPYEAEALLHEKDLDSQVSFIQGVTNRIVDEKATLAKEWTDVFKDYPERGLDMAIYETRKRKDFQNLPLLLEAKGKLRSNGHHLMAVDYVIHQWQ